MSAFQAPASIPATKKCRQLRLGESAATDVDVMSIARHDAHMSITAIVENGTIKLPVHVPDGTRVEVTVLEEKTLPQQESILGWMKKYAGSIEGPEDFAAEHDHYIHGTPKRAER
jgi:hypothetical protein